MEPSKGTVCFQSFIYHIFKHLHPYFEPTAPYLNLIAYPAIFPIWIIHGQLGNIKTATFSCLAIYCHIFLLQNLNVEWVKAYVL